MEILVGIVKSNEDNTKSGKLRVEFPKFNNRVFSVTFTSPYYRMNAGGMVAIPEKDTQVLVLHNKNPRKGESLFYFHSCVVSDMPRETNDGINKDYVTLRDNDPKAKIYMDKVPFASKPVTQMFTNTAGAGLYIQRDFDTPTMSNNVTLKSEMDAEVNVGALGVQIRNEEGDSINLAGSNGGDFYADRSLNISTKGPQEYKCTNSDINMRIIDGGDINIENNSTGMMSFGSAPGMPQPENPFPGIFPWSGNIRLKSRYRNIDLAALGEFSDINIVTNLAKIKLNQTTGSIEIFTNGPGGNIKMTSMLGNIELNAPAGQVLINGGTGVSIGSTLGPVGINSTGSVGINSTGSVGINSNALVATTAPSVTNNGVAVTIPGHSSSLPPGIPPPPDIPPLIAVSPGGNDYSDGYITPAGGAV